MPANRFFVEDPLKLNQELFLEGDEFHHLARVMRGRVGESLELINGKGSLVYGRIEALEKTRARLLVTEVVMIKEPPTPRILALPITQGSKLSIILEKGCELGATAFWLYPGEKS